MAHWTKPRAAIALLLAALAIACASRDKNEFIMTVPTDPSVMPTEYHGSHISRDGIRDRLPSES